MTLDEGAGPRGNQKAKQVTRSGLTSINIGNWEPLDSLIQETTSLSGLVLEMWSATKNRGRMKDEEVQ